MTLEEAQRLTLAHARVGRQARRWRLVGLIARWVLVSLSLLVILSPIAFLMTTSLKPIAQVLASGAFLPDEPYWNNWRLAFQSLPLLAYLSNSLLVAPLSALLTLTLALPASYAMVRFKTGGSFLPGWILSTYLAPPIVFSVPIFFMIRGLRLIDNPLGLVLVHAVGNLAVAVWLLDGFIRALPAELEECAWIDGCTKFGTLWRIVTPLLRPGLVATGIICMILSWNEYLFASILTYTPAAQTYPVGIALFQGDRGLKFGQMAAAALSGMLPIYAIAFIFQRHLVKGLTTGSIR